ncbi:MAG: HAMP domain-containing sensor histidine kinase [Pseudonocardiales bacterium]
MFALPGKETIPYHLIWASFVFVYGLAPWSRAATWVTFFAITVVTGVPMVKDAAEGIIGWEECSEIVLMAVIAALLVWHVHRHQAAQRRIAELLESEKVRANNRELATRFGSHELRTRLTVARGFTDLIRDSANDQRTKSDAELVLSELDKASILANNLMTLVRVDLAFPQRPIRIDALIEAVVLRWATGVQRVWTKSSSAGTIFADAERLEAAMDCLIENAVKFTDQHDSISIAARIEETDVVISVEDTGAGIPSEDLDHVTELFHISSNAGERAGSGLGLPIVRAIVEARRGSLHITSSLGAGTRVTIRMPHGCPGRPPGQELIERPTLQVVRTPHVLSSVED